MHIHQGRAGIDGSSVRAKKIQCPVRHEHCQSISYIYIFSLPTILRLDTLIAIIHDANHLLFWGEADGNFVKFNPFILKLGFFFF